MSLRSAIIGIVSFTVLSIPSNSWGQEDDDWDWDDDSESNERSDEEEAEINLDDDPDEESIDGRSTESGDGLYLGEEYES